MRSIPVGLFTYRAKSNLFQFCCACACLCLHLVWCTVSASPHGMFSLSHQCNGELFPTLSSSMFLFLSLLSPTVWYSPSSHCITSTRYRPPSIRQLFPRQHQPRPPPKAKRRTDVSSCISQPIEPRCWWAAHQSICDGILQNLKNVILLYFFLPRSHIWLM